MTKKHTLHRALNLSNHLLTLFFLKALICYRIPRLEVLVMPLFMSQWIQRYDSLIVFARTFIISRSLYAMLSLITLGKSNLLLTDGYIHLETTRNSRYQLKLITASLTFMITKIRSTI